MEYSNANLSNEQTCLSCVELPKICIPIYREVIKEMAEVIKVPQMREVFYSLSIGIDVLTVSKKTGVAPRNLAYMYKKASRQVCLKWKPYSAWKQELDRIYIRCRNYAAFLTHYQECTGQNLKNVVIFVKEQDIPLEYVNLLTTPLGSLDINFRVLRALRKYNIYQLEDLLRFIKYNGFDALCRIPGVGTKSVEQLYHTLKERNILENKETCILFRYLLV